MGNWKKYWNALLTPHNGKTDGEARKRYDSYMKAIEKSIDEEAEKAAEQERMRMLRDGGGIGDEL
jgi:hypothetical protein